MANGNSSTAPTLNPEVAWHSPGKRKTYPLSSIRAHRKSQADGSITMIHVVTRTGISFHDLGEIERDPSKAKPGQLEIIRAAVDEMAAEIKAREARS